MSGGSMDYLYLKVLNAEFQKNTAMRKAFAEHLQYFSAALWHIEMVDSGDAAPGSEDEAIRKCVQQSKILESAISEAKAAQAALALEIECANRLDEPAKP